MPRTTLNDIEAIVFDAYGTLFDLETSLARREQRLGEAGPRLIELWRRKQLEYSWLRTLMGQHVDFWAITGEALDHAMAASGIEDVQLRAELMQVYLNLSPYPEVEGTMRSLRQTGFRLAILSNGTPSMLTSVLNKAALNPLFNQILSAEARGLYKPHPTVYQLAADELDVVAPHICFVSASGWDIAGAAAFGFQTVWVNRNGAKWEGLPFAPALEVRSLEELPAVLSRREAEG